MGGVLYTLVDSMDGEEGGGGIVSSPPDFHSSLCSANVFT